ncbi:MAG: acyl-CoA desaturase [Gammaproteobacteria bacterium]|nr:MAG: acyl-CoA desaturase [Gammaproteobacteria bacterium]
MAHGLVALPWWGLVLVTLALTHLTILSVTIYLHRHQAHRALDLHPAVAHGFRFWLWLTTGMVTREWVAIHRKHHARCETPEDPHSPRIEGLGTVLWRGAELYRQAAARTEILERYGRGTPDDVLERRLYARHPYLGIGLLLVGDLALFGPIGLSVWAVQMLWIPFWAAGVINGLGHWWGYRNFRTRDLSTNLVPWGLLIGGEELHNNHHAFPGSARLSARRFEFDIGWFWIRVLERLGLAQVHQVAVAPVLAEGRALDAEAVRSLPRLRQYVQADYVRRVLWPLLRAEYRRADASGRALLRRARGLLMREEALIPADDRAHLGRLASGSRELATALEFRRRLLALWESQAASSERLRAALHHWCREAERSGIEALASFAQRLPAYRVPAGT